jgi:hypothetical protein
MKKPIIKTLTVGALLILIFMSISPSVEAVVSLNTTNKTDKLSSTVINSLNKGSDPFPQIEGQMGENGWYVGAVSISFTYDPKIVDEIKYFLDGSWRVYEGPFLVEDEGIYNIPWYWIDEDGKQHDGTPIYFNMDLSPPTISLKKDDWTQNSITFLATTEDTLSSVAYVEFYLDDELVRTDDEGPYEYVWNGEEVHHEVYAISYNNAGLFEQSETLNTESLNLNQQQSIFNVIFQIIQFWQSLII